MSGISEQNPFVGPRPSSLVQAGLVPRLLGGGYDVWKPIRVNLDPTGLGVLAGTNRFIAARELAEASPSAAEGSRRPGRAAAGS